MIFKFTVRFRTSPGIPVYVKAYRLQDAMRFLNNRYPDAEVVYDKMVGDTHPYDFET